jgi:hypothetical protein
MIHCSLVRTCAMQPLLMQTPRIPNPFIPLERPTGNRTIDCAPHSFVMVSMTGLPTKLRTLCNMGLGMSSFVCTSRRKFPRTFKEPHKTFSPTAGLPFPDPEAIYGQAGLQKTWVSTLITFPKHWDVQMFESIALKCKR